MGKQFFFELKSLPDFSLTRYQAINLSDLGSVVKNNNVFLRQLHSLGLVLNMSFHLYYSFIPHLPHGERIKVVLMCQEESEKETVSYDILIDIISSFANASCYKLTKYEYAHLPAPLSRFSGVYNCFCTISKKENLTNPYYSKNTPKNGMQYYSISEWTAKQNARMYNSIKLLGNYKSDTVIRIDIYPVSDPNEILDSISKRGIYSMIQEEASFKAYNNSSGLGVSKRDEAANRANSFYENYFKTMSSSLQFNASINIFGNSEDNCRLLGDFLCSEVLEKGLISQRCELGKYAADYLLDAHKLHNTMEDSSGYKVPEMASRFTIDEIAPFFSFPYLYPSENIGIRKETDPDLSGEGIVIGTNSNGYCVRIPLKAFAKHAYISGVPGSGKTFTMKHIIHSLSKEGIPFLVFEPAKREYRGLYDVCKDNKKAEYGSFYDNEKTDDIILLCPKTNSLTLFEILTGKNPFEGLVPQNCINADLTDLQNAKENPQWWFPEKENGNALGLLISKLIEPEISQRWGYTEILRWHENINKSLIAQEVVSFHNRFNGSCKYNNVIVNDPKELIRKIAGNWDYEYLFNHFSEISYTDTYIANKTGLYIAYTHPKDPENISNEEKMSLMISLYCEFTQDDDEVFWPNKGFKNTFEFGNYLYNTINKLYGKYSSRENDYESLSYDSTFCILYSAAVAGLFSTYMSKDRLANTNERTKIITECEKVISKSNSFYDIIKSFALLAYTMMNICVFSITVPSSNQEIIVHSYEELGKVLRDNMNTYGDSIILLGSLIYNQKQISPIVQAWSDALKNYSGR